MSENVGLTTPRGSGTSGYVQRNWAFIKPRSRGSGAPYPPVDSSSTKPFKQRQPDKKILEHDRYRAVEVKVMEWREKLEEENEEIETENKNTKGKGKGEEGRKVLSEEEIEERCEDLRARLLKEMMSEEEGGGAGGGGGRGKKLKSFQVHELAEAKIEESERLRKALGIEEDRETGEISSHRPRRGYSDRERREERENERD